jgi:hypothetical protein
LYNNLNPEIELQIIVGNRLLDSTCW